MYASIPFNSYFIFDLIVPFVTTNSSRQETAKIICILFKHINREVDVKHVFVIHLHYSKRNWNAANSGRHCHFELNMRKAYKWVFAYQSRKSYLREEYTEPKMAALRNSHRKHDWQFSIDAKMIFLYIVYCTLNDSFLSSWYDSTSTLTYSFLLMRCYFSAFSHTTGHRLRRHPDIVFDDSILSIFTTIIPLLSETKRSIITTTEKQKTHWFKWLFNRQKTV